jgi:hypothetical protein
VDPDPGGLKRAKMKKKRRYETNIKINVIGIKMFIVTLFSLKINLIF